MLGDNHDLTAEEEQLLLAREPAKIALGPQSLHADHCIVIVQNELDRQQAAGQQ